jgi:hypothetical protein
MQHHRSAKLARGILIAAAVLAAVTGSALAATSSHTVARSTGGKLAQVQKQLAAARALNAKYSPAGIANQLKKTKAALAKYESVDAAKADGYAQSGPCAFAQAGAGEESSHAGAMGVHFVNNALATRPPNPLKPAVLVYAPLAGGGFQLVAAEYFQPDADQNVKTDGDRPTLFGRAFDGPMLGHSPGMPIHYDLHVWLWKHNPSGMFAPWNPDVSCT